MNLECPPRTSNAGVNHPQTILVAVSGSYKWPARYDFWRSMPAAARTLFLAGVFALFLPAGLLTDIPTLGANPPGRLALSALMAGLFAVGYVVIVWQRRAFLVPLIVLHVLAVTQFEV